MNIPRLMLFLSVAVAQIHAGELPLLSKQPWMGVYTGYERRDFLFAVNSKGEGELRPMGDKKKPISSKYWIKFQPLVEETMADGRVTAQAARKDGWEPVTPASEGAEKVVYRGTGSGGSTFEVTFELGGNEIRAGGKLLEKGKLKNPRFVMRVVIPNVYYYDRDDEKREEKAKRDRIDLLRTDRKKLKLDVLTPLDAESAEFGGPGIAQARIDLAGFKGHRFDFDAGAHAAFEFWNRGEDALYTGFTLGWKPDAEKDPEGMGRCILKVR